jgi:DNA-binding PadR family transcriptional regulator
MTSYQLAGQVTRAFQFVWSASRRLLLGEPARLAKDGLVEAIPAPQGSRAQQRWRGTEKGEAVLKEWLGTSVSATQLNSELQLRLMWADHADRDVILGRIAERRHQILDEARYGLGRIEEYQTTGGPFPERLHITTAMTRFVQQMGRAEHEYLVWLEAEVRQWDGTRTPNPERHRRELEAMRAQTVTLIEELEGRVRSGTQAIA